MKRVRIGKDAATELEEAAIWYENEQPGLGNRFIDAFENATQLLSEPTPPLTPMLGSPGSIGAKKLLLHKFPFSVIVYETSNEYIVVAVAHHSKKPGYWVERKDP